ncbi:MAG: ABC transporter permease subunit [Bacilli bacterium]|nr:ABC transporter permease subunit [Bacilli bacterium]NLN80587.1 sugar ABC transporter permease [Erysipelotrichia bacterium]
MDRILIAKKQSRFHDFKKKINRSKFLIFMGLPAVIFYFIFCYIPMYGVLMAFTHYYPKRGILGSLTTSFVGFNNFKTIFNDPYFWQVLGNTVFIGLGKIIISFVASLLIALLLNEIRMRVFKKSVQIIVTFPHFLSWVVVAGFVNLFFVTDGAINSIVVFFGGQPIDFLRNGPFFITLLFGSDIWKEAGWGSIIYLATMAGISPELYEAADIDGATRLQKIWHITLPAIKPTAILLLILSVGGILSAGFDQIFNLYNPLVYSVSDILDTYIYRSQFNDNVNAGITTAIGLFKSVVSFILVLTVDRIAKLSGERGII